MVTHINNVKSEFLNRIINHIIIIYVEYSLIFINMYTPSQSIFFITFYYFREFIIFKENISQFISMEIDRFYLKGQLIKSYFLHLLYHKKAYNKLIYFWER